MREQPNSSRKTTKAPNSSQTVGGKKKTQIKMNENPQIKRTIDRFLSTGKLPIANTILNCSSLTRSCELGLTRVRATMAMQTPNPTFKALNRNTSNLQKSWVLGLLKLELGFRNKNWKNLVPDFSFFVPASFLCEVFAILAALIPSCELSGIPSSTAPCGTKRQRFNSFCLFFLV